MLKRLVMRTRTLKYYVVKREIKPGEGRLLLEESVKVIGLWSLIILVPIVLVLCVTFLPIW